jgi:hypothetical protein
MQAQQFFEMLRVLFYFLFFVLHSLGSRLLTDVKLFRQ